MILIGFKTFEQAPEGVEYPAGTPTKYPWIEERGLTPDRAQHLRSLGYSVMDLEQYEQYLRSLVPVESVKRVIGDAMAFGVGLTQEFAAENVLLGITQLGATGAVLTKLKGVMDAVAAGSLYEAIARIKTIPEEDYDATFITEPRLLGFVNKIETYLGIPLSESL